MVIILIYETSIKKSVFNFNNIIFNCLLLVLLKVIDLTLKNIVIYGFYRIFKTKLLGNNMV